MKKTGRIVNLCILILGLAMIAYYIALGLAVRFGQSLQFLWLVVGLGCTARFAFWEWAYRRNLHFPVKPLWMLRIAVLVLVGIFLILCAWETRARYFFQYEMVLLCAGALLETRRKNV